MAQGCAVTLRNVVPAAGVSREAASSARVIPAPKDVLRHERSAKKASHFLVVGDATLGVTPVDYATTFVLLGLVVPVPAVPVYARFAPRVLPAPAHVELRITAEAEGYTLDPFETVLVLPDGRELRPASVHGPVSDTGWYHCGPAFGSEELTVRPGEPGASIEHVVPRFERKSVYQSLRACFQLTFDAPWELERPPQLVVRGLKRAGVPVPVPAIAFRGDAFWQFVSLP